MFYNSRILLVSLLIFISHQSLAQWMPLNGPYGGAHISCLAVNDSVIYAGTDGGLYSSSNKGNLWTKATSGLKNVIIESIEFYDQKIYIATRDSGIFFSDNNGLSWNSANTGLTQLKAVKILNIDSLLIVGTADSGIFISDNGGLNWAISNNGLTNKKISDMVFQGSVLLAGTRYGGVFVSTDNGVNWNISNTGLSNLSITSLASDSNQVVVTTNGGGFYRSDDFGANWVYKFVSSYCRAAYIHNGDIYLSPFGGSVKKSSDNGDTWTTLSNGLVPYISIYDFLIYDNEIFAATSGTGVFKSINSGNLWFQQHQGMKGRVRDVTAFGNHIFAATYGDGVFWSDNQGITWNPVNIGLPSRILYSIGHIGTTIFAGTNMGLFRSTNFGISWDSVPYLSNGIIHDINVQNNVVSVAKSASPHAAFSVDSGLTWSNYTAGLSSEGRSVARYYNFVFLGAQMSPYGYYSADAGWSWASIPATSLSSTIGSAAFTTSHIFAGGSTIWRSDFSGTNWAPGNNGWPLNTSCWTLHSLGSSIYAGGDKGIYSSIDNGITWVNFNDGLDYLSTQSIYSDSINLYAATSDGVWTYSLTSSIEDPAVSGIKSELLVYPNPTSGQLFLYCYDFCDYSMVEIYDVIGNVIFRSQFGNESEMSIDLFGAPKGIYFLRAFNSEGSAVRKVVVN